MYHPSRIHPLSLSTYARLRRGESQKRPHPYVSRSHHFPARFFALLSRSENAKRLGPGLTVLGLAAAASSASAIAFARPPSPASRTTAVTAASSASTAARQRVVHSGLCVFPLGGGERRGRLRRRKRHQLAQFVPGEPPTVVVRPAHVKRSVTLAAHARRPGLRVLEKLSLKHLLLNRPRRE